MIILTYLESIEPVKWNILPEFSFFSIIVQSFLSCSDFPAEYLCITKFVVMIRAQHSFTTIEQRLQKWKQGFPILN